MNYMVKQGSVLVSPVDRESICDSLHDSFLVGKVEHGNPEDIGAILIYEKSRVFNNELDLVKADDVIAWIPKSNLLVAQDALKENL